MKENSREAEKRMFEEMDLMSGREIQVLTWAVPHHIRFVIEKFKTCNTVDPKGGAYTKLYMDLDLSKGEFSWSVRPKVVDIPSWGMLEVDGGRYKNFKTLAEAYKYFRRLRAVHDAQEGVD